MKKCYHCQQFLPYTSFSSNKAKPDGFCDACKLCKKELDKDYRLRNEEKLKLKSKEYYLKNREKIITRTCEYSKNNKLKVNAIAVKKRIRLKQKVFSHYCNGVPKCHMCPVTD